MQTLVPLQFVSLSLAALCYSLAGYYMKLAEGLTRGWPSLAVMLLVCFGAGLQTWAMQKSEMAVTYLVVIGIEACTALIVGAVLLHEGVTLTRLIGIIVITVGITLVRT